jgi:hypothetical protein
MLSPSSSRSVRQTGPEVAVGSVILDEPGADGVSSTMAANSKMSMSAMPPSAWRPSR